MKGVTNKKLSILFVMCFAISLALTGCKPSFDASGYVKACLDANTKGEFEEYAEITNSTIEEIESLYNQSIESEMQYIEGYNVSDDKKEEFRQLFIDIYKSCKYEVGEATLNEDDSYTVPIKTYKLIIFEGIMSEGETYLTSYAQAEVDAGRTPTQEQLEAEAINFMYDAIKKNLDKLQYEEPVTLYITVSPSKDGSTVYYAIDSLHAIMRSMIDIENAQ